MSEMTNKELQSLVNDLCLLQLGWESEKDGELYQAARGRVVVQGIKARNLLMIELLKSKIAQLEGNT